MARYVVLLRGVNLASRNRIAMPALRDALTEAGFDDVATYLQSGNVVLSSAASAKSVARKCERVIEESFGLDIDVVVRTRAELASVVKRDPLGKLATDPKRYQVTFLATRPSAALVKKVEEAAVEPERLEASGRELYAWHPNGIGRSKLATLLSGPRLGIIGTARNWVTVTKLLELAKA